MHTCSNGINISTSSIEMLDEICSQIHRGLKYNAQEHLIRFYLNRRTAGEVDFLFRWSLSNVGKLR